MVRFLYTFIATVFAILLIACGVLWIRSYSHCDEIHRTSRRDDRYGKWVTGDHSLFWADGRLAYARLRSTVDTSIYAIPPISYHSKWWTDHRPPIFESPKDSATAKLGFGTAKDHDFGGGRRVAGGQMMSRYTERVVWVPFWFAMLVTAVPPGLWWRSVNRRRLAKYRLKHHLCHVCGYDLQATPDRCPECGTEATVRAASHP